MIRQETREKCILCGSSEELTAEHKIKASLLKYFNDLQGEPDKILMFYDRSDFGGEFSNTKNAKNLKPVKNICTECNGLRSQESDGYFDEFVKKTYLDQKSIVEVGELVSPSDDEIRKEVEHFKRNLIIQLDDTNWSKMILWANTKYFLTRKYQIYRHSYNEELIKKYLAKHTSCYIDRVGEEALGHLQDIFISGTSLEYLEFTIYFLPTDFQHGYMNTALKYPKGKIEYALIFSNLAIQVSVKV